MELKVNATQAPGGVAAAMSLIRDALGPSVIRLGLLQNGDIELEIERGAVIHTAQLLRDEPALDFKYFSCVLGVDRGECLEVVYILSSLAKGIRLQLKVKLDPHLPEVDSVTGVWAGANWHERETYDMFGIRFRGHPYLHRMFLDEDFEGYPLLKSFKLAGRAE